MPITLNSWDKVPLILLSIYHSKCRMSQQRGYFLWKCHLAGRQYHDVDEVWDRLQVGTKLRLERDMDIGVSSASTVFSVC